jgi:hypothetical protein
MSNDTEKTDPDHSTEQEPVRKDGGFPRRGRHRKWMKHHPNGECVCGHTSAEHAVIGWCKAKKPGRVRSVKNGILKEPKDADIKDGQVACGCQCMRPVAVYGKKKSA